MGTEAIRVTVTDPATGEVLGEQIVDNDYLLICAGRRWLKHTNVSGTTHVLTVALDSSSDGSRDG